MQTSTRKVEIEAKHNFQIDLKLPQETRLRFSGEYEPLTAWRILSRYVSRYPHDLRVHAQRILLSIDTELADYLPGAIQDLKIALSGKGKPFFKSLLELARSTLSETDYTHFLKTLDDEEQNHCWRKGSVLANGICEVQPLVTYIGNDEEAGFANIMEEAQAYIEYGQIDEAKELLETELLKNPDAKDVEEELLYLYQSMRQRSHIETMSNNLLALDVELSPEWKQCLAEANSWQTG